MADAFQAILENATYALIDPLAMDRVPDYLPVRPVVPATFERDAHLMPLLVPLGELTHEQWVRLRRDMSRAMETGQDAPVAMVFRGDTDIDRMVSRLAARMIVSLASGQRALLRFYDPRVFVQLRWMLSDSQGAFLSRGINGWAAWVAGEWRRFDPWPHVSPSWRFSAEQTARLDRIGLINRVLAGLARPFPGEAQQLGQIIDGLLVRASEIHGFSRYEDMAAFAAHGVSIHKDFDRHPVVKTLIGRLSTEGQTYADAACLLSESQWQGIAADMKKAARTT